MTSAERDQLDAAVLNDLKKWPTCARPQTAVIAVLTFAKTDDTDAVRRSLRRLERRGLVTSTKVGGRWHWKAVGQ